jgi:hypothetical protein
MTACVVTDNSISSLPWGITDLNTALQTAMGNAGFATLYDTVTTTGVNMYFSSDTTIKQYVYQVVNSAAAKGTIYFIVSTMTYNAGGYTGYCYISCAMSTGWDLGTHAPTGDVVGGFGFSDLVGTSPAVRLGPFFTQYTPLINQTGGALPGTFISPNAPVYFRAVNHPEYKAVFLQANNFIVSISYFVPANKPSWWDEDNYPYCFMGNSYNPGSFYGFPTSGNPFNYGSTYVPANYNLQRYALNLGNPGQGNKRELVPGIILADPSVNATLGRTSDDFCSAAANGLGIWDVLQVIPGTQEYVVLTGGTSGVVLRSV